MTFGRPGNLGKQGILQIALGRFDGVQRITDWQFLRLPGSRSAFQLLSSKP
jgi:hypothetical protein